MSAKRIESIQPGLFDPQEPSDPGTVLDYARSENAVPGASSAAFRALTAQVARDEQTLRLGPNWWVPSREFFEERVASYRAAALAMTR